MKPTQLTELLANIRKTFVSFFSILMFAALGVGIYLGISWSGPALENAVDRMFAEGALHNFQVQYSYGLTDDDLAKLAELEGVTDVEKVRQSFQATSTPAGKRVTVKVQTLTERIDVPAVVEGELPEKPNEIALNSVAAKEHGFGVGDRVVFEKDASGGEEDPLAQIEALGEGDSSSAASAAPDADATGDEPADKDGMKFLNASTYTVTALVDSPEYLAKESTTYGLSNAPSGMVDLLGWVPASAFDGKAFEDGYPVVDIACSELAGLNSFGDEYKAKSDALQKRLEDLGEMLATARFDSLHASAQAKIDDAEKQLEEGRQKIADGEKQLADGTAELETQKAEGQAKLADAYSQLMQGEAAKQQGEAKLAESRALVAEGEAELASADEAKAAVRSTIDGFTQQGNAVEAKYPPPRTEQAQAARDAELDALGELATTTLQAYAAMVGETVAPINHANYFESLAGTKALLDDFENMTVDVHGEQMTVAQARAKLAAAKQELANGEAELSQRTAQLNAGWAEYYASQDEAARLVAEGEQRIADAETQLAEAKQQVAENEPKLADAKEQFNAMKARKLAVLPRSHNASYAEAVTFSGTTTRLSYSMAALFIIVGLLVTYSAVGRIVYEQIIQIGTKKALGLRNREITMSFLMYSGLAVLCGAVIGTIVGIIAVEGIIGHVLGSMFTFGDYPPHFGLWLFLVVTFLELVLVILATWFACRGNLKKHAIELLRGESPPEGKTRFYEKWNMWDKLPLFTQTIVNNCVNDRRRVFSTIVGVAGCTALIVTAITLNNDVLKSYDVHYSNVYGFNAIVYVDPSVDGAVEGAARTLEAEGATAAPVLRKGFVVNQPDGDRGSVRVIVPAGEAAFEGAYHVNSTSGGSFSLSDEGAWVSQAYRDHFGAKVGDTLKIEDSDGAVHEVPILGFSEFWLTYSEIVMGRAYYESTFNEDPKPNAVLSNTGAASVDDLASALKDVPGFDSIVDDKSNQHRNFETFSNVSSAVVLIYMVLAVLMAVVVLLNLNVMFIEEKKRELIVLRINGFSVKDAKRYIYNDTIVLTAVGIVLGVALGCAMGAITVGAIENSTASFVKGVDLMAVLVGTVGSALLAFVMSAIALRRIEGFNLVDINKA